MRTETARTRPKPRRGPALGVHGRVTWPLLKLSHGDMGSSLTPRDKAAQVSLYRDRTWDLCYQGQ